MVNDREPPQPLYAAIFEDSEVGWEFLDYIIGARVHLQYLRFESVTEIDELTKQRESEDILYRKKKHVKGQYSKITELEVSRIWQHISS